MLDRRGPVRGHVTRRPQSDARRGDIRRLVESFRQSEIGDFGMGPVSRPRGPKTRLLLGVLPASTGARFGFVGSSDTSGS